MKRVLALLTCVCLLLSVAPISAWAESSVIDSGSCGENLNYVLYDDGELVISGEGAMEDYYPEPALSINAPWFANQEHITSVVIEDGVTTIGKDAFCNCSSLISVTISASVANIGRGVFDGCTSLTQIRVSEANAVYSSDASGVLFDKEKTTLLVAPGALAGEYTIADSVTSIGDCAFNGCANLTGVTIPNSVTTIGTYAFNECSNLREITIPNSVTTISEGAFYYCSSLTKANIPNSVTTIGVKAFERCAGLEEIVIPDSVTSIGNSAFCYCSSLSEVTIPASVTTIDAAAFANCAALTSVTFLGNAPAITYSSMAGCFSSVTATMYYPCGDVTWTEDVMQDYGGNLTWEAISNERKIISSGSCGENATYVLYSDGELVISGEGAMADYSMREETPWYASYESITSVVIEDGVTSIGTRAFEGCKNLTNVAVADTVTVINGMAFAYCEALTNINIPESVSVIGSWAFQSCVSLTSISIPGGVTFVGDSTFTGCKALTSLTIGDGVTAIVDYAFASCEALTNVVIPDSVTAIGASAFACCTSLKSITIPDSVTSIKKRAFEGCSSLTEIVIPDSVTSIANYVFSCCSSLTGVTIPGRVTTIGSGSFSDCSNLTEIAIPNSVTSIGSSAFANCTGLTEIIIPDSITTIGENAFSGCSTLTSVTFQGNAPSFAADPMVGGMFFNGVTATMYYPCGNVTWTEDVMQNYGGTLTWEAISNERKIISSGSCGETVEYVLYSDGELVISGEGAMADYAQYYPDSDRAPWYVHQKDITSVVIEDGVTTIGNNAFVDCKNLTNVTIGDSVTSIGDGAFSQCNNLVSVNIPDSVTTIGTFAFNYCTSLKEIVIPDSVTTIAAGMFHSCSGLQEIIIPDSVTSIGGSAFMGCSSLTEVAIPSKVTAIDGRAFYYCSNLINVTIPDGVTTIGEEAFYYCTSLKEIVIPNGVKSIGDWAFLGCSGLTNVNIPESVTSIGDSAFSYCSGLTSVTIPDSLTSIPSGAFSYCSSLNNVTIPDSVVSIGGSAFSYCTGLTEIVIPANVIAIGNGAFRGCSELTGIWVDEANLVYSSDAYGVLFNKEKTTLLEAPGALAGEYTIADSATNISDSAFFECSSLTKIIIPASVMTVGETAFYRCSYLTNVTFQGNAPSFAADPMMGGMIFSGVTATVYYPCGDGTWTEDVMKDYYGTLTWEMYHTNFVNGYCDGCDYDERVYYDANISLLYLDTNNEYGVINTTVRVPENATYQDLYDMVQFPAANAHSDSLGALTGWDLYYDGKSLSDTVVPVSYGGAPTVSFSLYAAYEYENFKYTVYYLDEKGEVASQSAQTLIPIGITFEEMLNTLNIPTYNYEQTHWFITGKGDPYYNSVTAAACYDGWFPVHVSASYTAENGDRTGRLGKFLYVDTLEEEAVKSAILKDLQSTELICPVGTVFSGYSFSYLQLTHNVVQDAMRGTACNGLFAEVSLDVVACPEHEFQNHVCVHCRYDDRTYYDANISLLYLDANDEYVQINTTVRVPETATYQDLYDMVQFPAANAHAASLGVLTDWDLYYEGKSLSDTVVPVSYGGTPTISFSLIAAYEYVNFIYTVYYLDEKGEVTSQSAETLMPVGVTFEEMLNTLNIPTYGYKQTHWSSLSKGEAYHNYVTAAICYDGLIPLRVAARYTAEDGDNLVMTYKYVYTDTQDEATVKSAVLQMLQASEDVCPVGRVISDYSFSSLQLTHNVSQNDWVGTSCIGLYADVTVETVTCTEHNFKNGACAHCYITCKELGHDEQQHSGKAATCTTAGWKAYVTCNRCDYTTYKEIAALGHKMTKVPAKAATYTTNGNVEYYICSGCNKLFADAMGERVISAVDTVIAKLPTVVIEKEENKGDSGDTITETPKVEVKVEVKAEAIDEVIVKAAEEAKENKDAPVVVIDVKKEVVETIQKEDSAIKEEQIKVAEVSIPTATVEKVAELNKKSTLAVNLTTATVIMDNKAMEAVVEQANGDSVSLKVNSMEVANLNDNQQAAVSGKKIALTISAELICDETGEKLATKDAKGFGGGEVTMAVPLPEELPENVKASDLKVYFISDDGKMEHVSSKLDENGNIIITLKHFSEYVITADALETSTAPVTGDNTNVVLYSVLTIMAVMGMAVVLKKKAF